MREVNIRSEASNQMAGLLVTSERLVVQDY